MSSINGAPARTKRFVTPALYGTTGDDARRCKVIDEWLQRKGFPVDERGRAHVFRGFPTDRAKSASDRVDHC